jgi:hypothetical protein
MQQILPGCIIILLIAYVIYKRLRPQVVRPQRLVLTATVIIVLSIISLFSTNTIFTHTLALILALPALIIGLVGGFLLMRSIHFWRDETTGALWMKGGVVYLAVWLITLLLREGAAYASGEYTGGKVPFTLNPTLTALATDLIIVSIGLWIARTTALVLKYRDYQQQEPDPLVREHVVN